MLNEKLLILTLALAAIVGIAVSAVIGGFAYLFAPGYGYTLFFAGACTSLVVGAGGFFINRYLNINKILGWFK